MRTTIATQPGQSPTTRATARHRSHDGFWEVWTRYDLFSVLACPFSDNVSELGFRHMICNSARSDMKLAAACQQPWPFHCLSRLRQSAVDWSRRMPGPSVAASVRTPAEQALTRTSGVGGHVWPSGRKWARVGRPHVITHPHSGGPQGRSHRATQSSRR